MVVPLTAAAFRGMFKRVHYQVTQALATVEVGVHELKSYFVRAGAAQKHQSANMAHACLKVNLGVGADA